MAGPLLRTLWSSTGKSISSSSSCSSQSTVLKPYIYARGLTRPFSTAAGAAASSSADSGGTLDPSGLRNVAVIAHGKTTLMKRLLRRCGADIPHERAMDSISLELTGGRIGDRLMAEAETNLAINVIPALSDSYEVQGRGELQLGILIKNMWREGFELSVSPPKVMGLVGYRSVFSSDTRGIGFMQRSFRTYAKHRGPLGNVRKGVLAYDGMIVGEHSQDTDLDVNPVRAKELTNVCAAGKDENVKLDPPCLMTLEEEAIGYIASDELIEKPPKNDSDPMIKRFEEWMKRHSRQYRDEDEWKYRFETYRKNVQFIDHVNSQNLSYKLGDNMFADMTSEEFKSKCTGHKPWRKRIV